MDRIDRAIAIKSKSIARQKSICLILKEEELKKALSGEEEEKSKSKSRKDSKPANNQEETLSK
jgi:hypothetical protein